MPWQDFLDQKPTSPKAFRLTLAQVDYYNFGFKDDMKWQSYSLESPDKAHIVYGYVEKESVLNSKIKLNPDVKSSPMMLSLKFPEGALTSNQVIIEDLVGEGWIEPITPP